MKGIRILVVVLLLVGYSCILIGCSSNSNRLNDYLCADDEKVLFSFHVESAPKVVSILIAQNQPDYIVFRIGTQAKLELEFPKNKANSWQQFTYSYYLRGGGPDNEGMDLNHLLFEHGGKEYEVYQEYIAADDATYVGVRITDKSTKVHEEIKGLTDSVIGSLIELRSNDKITKVLP